MQNPDFRKRNEQQCIFYKISILFLNSSFKISYKNNSNIISLIQRKSYGITVDFSSNIFHNLNY